MMNLTSSNPIVRQLSQQILNLEQGTRRQDQSHRSSSCPAFDHLLGGGFRPGSLLEWLLDQGVGGISLALTLLRQSVGDDRRTLILIDPRRRVYPPALVALGFELSRLVIVHPKSPPETWWVLEQCLRSRGVSAVICALDRIDATSFRRLSLAANHGSALGMLFRSSEFAEEPSWADFRIQIQRSERPARQLTDHRMSVDLDQRSAGRPPGLSKGNPNQTPRMPAEPRRRDRPVVAFNSTPAASRRCLVEILHARHGKTGKLELELIHAKTGGMSVVSSAFHPTPSLRTTGT